jgi:anti-sigma regulatory factor (Ser/Thr protein kinase)
MNVALDEMLSNIIKYGYTDDAIHEIHLRLSVAGSLLGRRDRGRQPAVRSLRAAAP